MLQLEPPQNSTPRLRRWPRPKSTRYPTGFPQSRDPVRSGGLSLNKQSGLITLAISFILLIGVTLLTINSSKLSVLELSVSSSYEDRQSAFNTADSGADALFANIRNVIDLNKSIGYKNCTASASLLEADGSCDENLITSAAGWPYGSAKYQASAVYERRGCPPRSLDTSCSHVQFAHYRFTSVYNNTSSRASKAAVTVGVMELVPNF